jgi:hypothetical protein
MQSVGALETQPEERRRLAKLWVSFSFSLLLLIYPYIGWEG